MQIRLERTAHKEDLVTSHHHQQAPFVYPGFVGTYGVYNHSRKNRCGDRSSVLWIFGRADHGVVVCFEQGADD